MKTPKQWHFTVQMVMVLTVGLAPAPNAAQQLEGGSAQTHASSIEALAQAARKKSAALAPSQKKAAQELFATAFSLFQQGDLASARIGFERGLGADPGDAAAHFYLAETLVRLNDLAGAREHYELAAALSPNSKEGLKASAQIDKLEAGRKEMEAKAHLSVGPFERVAQEVVRDRRSGLEWMAQDRGVISNFEDAQAFCLAKGGGWRLPTGAELKWLCQGGQKEGRTVGDSLRCNLSPMFILRTNLFWSTTNITWRDKVEANHWLFDLEGGYQNWGSEFGESDRTVAAKAKAGTLCVRSK